MSQKSITCRACKQDVLRPYEHERVYHPPTAQVRVSLLGSICRKCGATTVLASQHDENLKRLAKRKESYGPYLLGEDILALRRRYGLTQHAMGLIFGKGKLSFGRYEDERSYPDMACTLLLRLAIKHPFVLKELADESGVPVPLWQERMQDQQEQAAGCCP